MEPKLVNILRRMLKYSQKMIRFCEDADYQTFLEDEKLFDACVMNLCNLGEQARHMPDSFRDAHPELPWRAMYFMRNRVAHDYEGLRHEIIWQAIQTDIPCLRDQLEALLKEARP